MNAVGLVCPITLYSINSIWCATISFTWGSVLSSSDKQSIALLNTSSTSFFSWPKKVTEKRMINFMSTGKPNWSIGSGHGTSHGESFGPLFPNHIGINKCWFWWREENEITQRWKIYRAKDVNRHQVQPTWQEVWDSTIGEGLGKGESCHANPATPYSMYRMPGHKCAKHSRRYPVEKSWKANCAIHC